MSFEPVLAELQKDGIKVAGSIIEIPNVYGGIFIPVHVVRATDGSLRPTKMAFVGAKARLEALGYLPEFLFVNEQSEEAEHFLRASLLVSFPDVVRNVFLSVGSSVSNVWIDQKRALECDERNRIRDHVDQFVQLLRLPRASVLSLSEIALPTKFELLALIRAKAPVDCETLRDALVERGLTVPSLDWINRQFDNLRKSGLVVRRHDRRYSVTLDALRRLGTRKNGRSPDVHRLLALAQGRV